MPGHTAHPYPRYCVIHVIIPSTLLCSGAEWVGNIREMTIALCRPSSIHFDGELPWLPRTHMPSELILILTDRWQCCMSYMFWECSRGASSASSQLSIPCCERMVSFMGGWTNFGPTDHVHMYAEYWGKLICHALLFLFMQGTVCGVYPSQEVLISLTCDLWLLCTISVQNVKCQSSLWPAPSLHYWNLPSQNKTHKKKHNCRQGSILLKLEGVLSHEFAGYIAPVLLCFLFTHPYPSEKIW